MPIQTFTKEDIDRNKDYAAFSYIWLFSVIVFITKRHSPFALHHARQGIVLSLIIIPCWFIPIVGTLLTMVIIAGMMYGFIHAVQGSPADVPGIGGLSRGELTWRDIFSLFSRRLSVFQWAQKKVAQKKSGPTSPDGSTV